MRKATRKVKRKAAGRTVRPGAKAWSTADIRHLVVSYKTKTAQQVADTMGRTLASVKAKIRTLNLKKGTAARRQGGNRRRASARRAAPRGNARRRTAMRR